MPRLKLVSTFAAVVGLTISMSSPTLAIVDTTKPQPSIGILADDVSSLPADLLMEMKGAQVTLETAETAPINALLVSRAKVSELAKNENKRQKLATLLRKKVLITYNSTPVEVGQILNIDLPQMTPRDEKYVVASLKLFGQGGSISGGVLVGDEARATSAHELVADIHAHLQEVQKLVDRYQIQTAAYLLSPNVTTNYLNECPLGKYNENVIAQKVIDDGSASYDFWAVELEEQTIAGVSTTSGCSGSDWRIVGQRSANTLQNSGAVLYKYGPTTSNPDTSVSVDVGFTAGYKEASFNAAKSWSWSLPSVSITDMSDFSTLAARWQMRYDYYSAAATNTFLSEPGFSARIPNNAVFTFNATRYMNVDAPLYLGESTSPQRFRTYQFNP